MHPFPGFSALGAGPTTAFVAGECGVRLRVTGSKVERDATPRPRMRFLPDGKCSAHIWHVSVAAWGDRSAALLSTPRCGADPNQIWSNALEVYDGSRWRKSPLEFGTGAHESDAEVIGAGRDGTVYALVQNDTWHGPPDDTVVRVEGRKAVAVRSGMSVEARRRLSTPHVTPGKENQLADGVSLEHYKALAVASRDDVWITGVRSRVGGDREPSGNGGSSLVWHFDGGSWTETTLEGADLATIAVGSDGTVVATGDSLHRRRPGEGWEVLPLPPKTGTAAVWVGAADDVWIAYACDGTGCDRPVVLHHDGKRFQRVQVEAFAKGSDEEAGPVLFLASAAGAPVWLASKRALWRLDRPKER
jgi:hypothetical protein